MSSKITVWFSLLSKLIYLYLVTSICSSTISSQKLFNQNKTKTCFQKATQCLHFVAVWVENVTAIAAN